MQEACPGRELIPAWVAEQHKKARTRILDPSSVLPGSASNQNDDESDGDASPADEQCGGSSGAMVTDARRALEVPVSDSIARADGRLEKEKRMDASL